MCLRWVRPQRWDLPTPQPLPQAGQLTRGGLCRSTLCLPSGLLSQSCPQDPTHQPFPPVTASSLTQALCPSGLPPSPTCVSHLSPCPWLVICNLCVVSSQMSLSDLPGESRSSLPTLHRYSLSPFLLGLLTAFPFSNHLPDRVQALCVRGLLSCSQLQSIEWPL